MIRAIVRILLLAIVVIAGAWAVSWIIERGGQVPIQFQGKEYRPTLMAVLLAIIVGLCLFWLFVKLVEFGLAVVAFLMGDKNAISRFFGQRRSKRGMKALETSALALAVGDSKTALSNAYRANKDLDAPALTNLFVAQAAKAQGKTKEAEEAYKNLLKTSKAGRFVGIRGLMEERVQSGDSEAAAQLAQKALEIQPKDTTVVNSLFDLQVKESDWKGARETLKAKAKLEKMPADVAKRREAVLAISEAKSIDRTSEPTAYSEAVMRAYRLAPNLVPAADMAARLQADEGDVRQANGMIVKAWNANPHPDLAATFAELVPDETPEARLRRFKVLTNRQKNNKETKMLRAELLIAKEDFPGARRAMGDLAKDPHSARELAIMAAIENGEGADDTVVRAFLARAMQASRGEQWVCSNCHEVHTEWEAVCANCQGFDTIEWKIPPEGNDRDTGMGVLLPLLTSSDGDGDVVDVPTQKDDVEDAEVVT